MNRRTFLQTTSLSLLARRGFAAAPALNPATLTRFADPLPVPPIARTSGTRPVPGGGAARAPYYRVAMRQTEAKLHRDLPPTRLWTLGGSFPGPTLETRSGQGLFVEWANELPEAHLLPIDHTLHGAAAGMPESRGVVHVHGAKVPPESDGYPEDSYGPGQSRTYYYPNQQDAAALWYHDHAMGINRLNIYAGMLGMFLIRDQAEDGLHLPAGPYEIPLVLCDRLLRQDGQLDYPVSGDPAKPWVPELVGNVMLVNGKAFPYLDVEPRMYRFRVLNAANSRFFHLSLANGQSFYSIGSDQGLLGAPVQLQQTMLAPAERADLVVDFAGHGGEKIVLTSDTFPLVQFRVGPGSAREPGKLPEVLRPVTKIAESAAVRTRPLGLAEQKTRTGDSMTMLLNGQPWHAPVTENPTLDTVEIWSLLNTTDDTHPIHLHLVKFQVLDRRRFEPFYYLAAGQIRYTGPAEPPAPEEAGWKDTVRAYSGMVTRIVVRFEGYVGRYVWHCHILEHEDNEMMRPYDVIPGK